MGENKLSVNKKRMMTKKTGILKTFEIFNRETITMLKDKLIEIILIETENIFSKNKKMFNVDFKKDDSVQISILNDQKTYHLLSNTWKRHKMKYGKTDDKNTQSTIPNKLSAS